MDHRSTSVSPLGLAQPRTRLIFRFILAFNSALALGAVGLWLLAVQQDLIWRADFSAFYTGWFMVSDGASAQLYDLAAQAAAQRIVLDGRSFADGLLPYVNPPHLTLPFVPLAWLPLSTAYGVWAIVQVTLIALCIRLLLELTADMPRIFAVQGIVAFLAFPPLAGTLLRGTFSLLLLAALLLVYRALEQGRERIAGLWLVLISLKPQLLLAPGALIVGSRRIPAILSLALGGMALAAVATVAFGWPIWGAYLQALTEVNTYFGRNGIHPAQMTNLRGVLTNLLGVERAGWINALSSAAFVLGGLGLIRLWWGAPSLQKPAGALRFALSITVGLLLSPHLYSHDALLLVLPLALLARHLYLHTSRRAYAVLVLLTPVLWFLGETLAGPLFLAGLMILFALVIWRELRAIPAGSL
jgi:hypothetical protein